MATFETNIARIRSDAIYGKDVREAIAQGLEQADARALAKIGSDVAPQVDARIQAAANELINNRVVPLETRVTTISANADSLDDRATQLETNVSQLDDSITQSDARATQLYTQMDTRATQLYTQMDTRATQLYTQSDARATQLYTQSDARATQLDDRVTSVKNQIDNEEIYVNLTALGNDAWLMEISP